MNEEHDHGPAGAEEPPRRTDRGAARRKEAARSPRAERIANRARPAQWRLPPLRIEQSECISCDACVEACPSQFGAVFNLEHGMVIVPELCSGCGKCLPPVCPVDCIYPDESWSHAPEEWWSQALGPQDPYVQPDGSRRPANLPPRIRRW
ncbi:MAG TPA: 4Fe-4S dicluster-binding protein [Streptomyces sp.]|uniref:indolepyruvate ferredoxin oxidoreductase subunit alpha n=1 Tax=Streptomyces sp. TaxID=1931 RepID=UPI002D371AC7|nr:4Fe-4S dicluster-binding protein [Streptomyces sp.]HZG05589.1 4Fe-4S dicluster-binding protein [Streptomyces sp.]